MKISVCIPTYNGSQYIKSQLSSILAQLGQNDEVVISDQNSTDNTVEIIKSCNDPRIFLFTHQPRQNKYKGIFKTVSYISDNCHNALKHASGDIIFLADQDDVWLEGKVIKVCSELQNADLVLHNCHVVNSQEETISDNYFKISPVRISFIGLLRKSSFMGCCMAFNRKLYNFVVPFPEILVEHDAWIGIQALKHGKIKVINQPLINYRRHGDNVSPCGEKSPNSLWVKIKRRIYLIQAYLFRR